MAPLNLRKSCSAPVRLRNSIGIDIISQLPSVQSMDNSTKHAWVSSEALEGYQRTDSNYQSGNESQNISIFRGSCAKDMQLDHLHIHSFSYPEWPTLSHTDPAIDLIKAIKEELNKFDHQSQ